MNLRGNKDRQALNEILDRLYRVRDLEISNLWQRSVFLSTFLLLCYTGYGILIFHLATQGNENNHGLLHFAAMCICAVGVILSLLVIMMAKGSKAWYEVYEHAITKFENDYWPELNIPRYAVMGSLRVPRDKWNDCILSTKGGAYSPSKINIFIGQISLIIMALLFIVHTVTVLFKFSWRNHLYALAFFIVIGFIVSLWFIWCTDHVRSGYLTEENIPLFHNHDDKPKKACFFKKMLSKKIKNYFCKKK